MVLKFVGQMESEIVANSKNPSIFVAKSVSGWSKIKSKT